jgi:alginate O-acetyltransferase complex protein AlgJ
MQTVSARLTVATFLAIVLFPVVLFGYNGPWPGRGEVAIRERAPFPYRVTPAVYGELDQWFADRVGLRFPLIYLATKLHVDLLQRPLDNHIFFGRDGWMFWTDDGEATPAVMVDVRGALRFKPAEMTRIESEVLMIRSRFAACNIPVRLVVAPNKQSIYGEFVLGESAVPPATRFDVLMGSLSDSAKAIIVDPRPTLRAAKREHAPLHLYNKTESHWNQLGAYYGYRAIIAALGQTMPIAHLELAALDNYQISVGPYPGGDMTTRVLFSPWTFKDENVSLTPKNMPLPQREVQFSDRDFITRNPQGKGRLLMFGDSFANGLVRYLAQHFAVVHRHVGVAIDGALVAQTQPDAVLFVTVERHAYRLITPSVRLDLACKR